MDGPCYNCAERYVGCHSGCERYQTWRKSFEENKDAMVRENKLRSDIDALSVKRVQDNKKKWRSR